MQELEGFTFATALDLNMGYYTIRLDSDASKICTIIFPWGKYSYKRLPMGIAGSPDIFQAEMMKLMESLEYVRAYIDDHHMANVDPPQEPGAVQVPPDIPVDGRRAKQRAQQCADDVADAHVRNITDQQLLNVDNHHDVLADDPQELVHDTGAVREQLGVHESESEQQFAAREEDAIA